MADIALLVAEEFEKRVKRGGAPNADGAEEPGSGRRNSAAVEKVWASGVRVNFAVRLRESEPKTGIGMAALDGFFSA